MSYKSEAGVKKKVNRKQTSESWTSEIVAVCSLLT